VISLVLAIAASVVLETDVPATMRDGVVLRADILRPDAPGLFPAIVLRTPYGKADEWRDSFAIRAARAGYVVVAQDVRGRYASDGVYHPYHQEGKDGYDTVEWAASLPYVNGKVGMAGLSYPGAVQWLAAMEKPPHLATITPLMCFSNARHFFFTGGAWDLSWISWFYLNIAPDARARVGLPGPKTDVEAQELWEKHREEWLRFLPLSELPVLRNTAPAYYEWLAHPEDGPYWDFAKSKRATARSRSRRSTSPAGTTRVTVPPGPFATTGARARTRAASSSVPGGAGRRGSIASVKENSISG